jgi:hypothetical protein
MPTFIASVALLTFLLGCTELTGGSTGALKKAANSLLVGGNESVEIATGNYLFSGTMDNGGRAGHNFDIDITLLQNEKATFTFASNRSLEGGLELTFTRTNQGLNLLANLNGKEHSFLIVNDSGSELFQLSIDIHNDHTDIHFLIWNSTGPFNDSDGCSFDGGCLYNSEDFALDAWLGVGRARGGNWGLKKTAPQKIKNAVGPRPPLSNA